jgi:hypothetical protein
MVAVPAALFAVAAVDPADQALGREGLQGDMNNRRSGESFVEDAVGDAPGQSPSGLG